MPRPLTPEEIAQQQAMAQQQRQMQEAAVQQFVAETARAIYCNLVAEMKVGQASPQGFRDAANFAKAAAPYLAEAVITGFTIQEETKQTCPHGEDPAECNACMVESDFQHDAAREGRMFGR